jgi:DNA-binding NtrC family response regulator
LSENGQLSKNDIPRYILEKYNEITNNISGVETPITNNKNIYDLDVAIANLEVKMITNAMIKSNGSKADAAKLLNINRSTLYYKLSQYNILHE